jgi:hypothetical protein
MRRDSYVARTVFLGIIADDIFGALINASLAPHNASLRTVSGVVIRYSCRPSPLPFVMPTQVDAELKTKM